LWTAWTKVRDKAKVVGRWHDNRHTLVTELAESRAGDEGIMSIAGHVSRAMLSRYFSFPVPRSTLAALVNPLGHPVCRQCPQGIVEAGSTDVRGVSSGGVFPCSLSPISKRDVIAVSDQVGKGT
jgi:hypothetical protein